MQAAGGFSGFHEASQIERSDHGRWSECTLATTPVDEHSRHCFLPVPSAVSRCPASLALLRSGFVRYRGECSDHEAFEGLHSSPARIARALQQLGHLCTLSADLPNSAP
jgi:hypothetical protein